MQLIIYTIIIKKKRITLGTRFLFFRRSADYKHFTPIMSQYSCTFLKASLYLSITSGDESSLK